MGDFSLNDTIGQALAAWTAVEQNRLSARLAQSREQANAYDVASRSSAQETRAMPAWLPVVGLVGLGLVVFVMVKK